MLVSIVPFAMGTKGNQTNNIIVITQLWVTDKKQNSTPVLSIEVGIRLEVYNMRLNHLLFKKG